jgi:phosphorylcholine metabolism protein LicD
MKNLVIAIGILILGAGGVWFGQHLEFKDPYGMSPIFLGAKMSPEQREKDPLKSVSLTPEAARESYDFLGKVIEILDRHQIEYWLAYGTLLGAVRHEGIIPYDDDLDIKIWKKDVPKLLSLVSEFSQVGIALTNAKLCLRVYKINGYDVRPKSKTFQIVPGVWFVRRKAEKFPCCDIFPMEEEGDKIVLNNKIMRRDEPNAYYLKDEFYPLKKISFGTIIANAPNDPTGFLARHYKADWNSMAYFEKNHSQANQEKIALKLTPEVMQQFYQYGVSTTQE